MQALSEIQRAAVDAVAADWRTVLSRLDCGLHQRSKAQGLRSAQPAGTTLQKNQRLEASARRLERALDRGTQTHGVEVTIISNGLRGDGPAAVVRAQPAPPPASPRLGRPEVIIAHVESMTGSSSCELRSFGSRRKQSGEFSALGLLPIQLALAAGCPAVHLKVRRYIFDESGRRPAVDFRIDEMVALSSAWFEGSPAVLDHLQQCLESLPALPRGDSAVQQSLP